MEWLKLPLSRLMELPGFDLAQLAPHATSAGGDFL